jgi:glycosyltransferase involved in cell wall biosynthesis
MKLIIQIPCLNEEKTLPRVLAEIPKSIPGISSIEVQIIDDGSTDDTQAVARAHGVKHIVEFTHNRGLAAAFKAGVDNALRLGADILVNTDGDGQYRGQSIPALVQPIVDGRADVVVGARSIDSHPEFSWLKKRLQRFGTWVLRKVSGASVEDAASGFRAYNQFALMNLNVFSHFSYTMETLIQAGYQNLHVVSVPIEVNPKTRESRLFRSIPHYLWQSGRTILNIFLIYKSVPTFSFFSGISLASGMALVARYLWLVNMMNAPRSSFWPTIVLAGCLLMLSVHLYIFGVQSMLISSNRKLLEETLLRLRIHDLNEENAKRGVASKESRTIAA